MRKAFKEWAIIVDALGHGAQILILRKGGLQEGPGGFQLQQPRFLLFPTLYHQQRESVLPEAQHRYDAIAPGFPAPDRLRLEYCAEVAAARKLNSADALAALRGQHIWRDEVLAERFTWGREQAIYALAVRVMRLPQAIDLPMLPTYGGCKSWIETDVDVSATEAQPVMTDADFADRLARFTTALNRLGMGQSLLTV